jgi:molybdopterin converting factor small subunit
MIKIKMMAALKEYAPSMDGDGCFALEHKPGMSVADALSRTRVAEANVNYSVLVNKVRKNAGDPLEDGDTVIVMPLLAGG